MVEVAAIGVGWVGGARVETLSRTALVDKLHICDIKPDRLAELKARYKPATATLDYQDIIKNDSISVVYISTTPPETNHYPIARDCLKAGKNVMLEKPIALELWEADELITLARRNNLKFTIGDSQRFNTKIAFAKKKIIDGTLGKVVSVLVSRHLSRALGKKIASRVRLSPVVMESTHDLDFVMWLLEPAKPVRVYSQGAYGYMEPIDGSHDMMFTTVTNDNGVVVMIGGGWNFPPSYPNYCSTWMRSPAPTARWCSTTRSATTGSTPSAARSFRCRQCRANRSATCSPAAWGRRRSISSKPASGHARDGDAGERACRHGDLFSRRSSANRVRPVDLPLTNETIARHRRVQSRSIGRASTRR